MTRDWVSLTENNKTTHIQVEIISPQLVSHYTPILLTYEILEKNGFIKWENETLNLRGYRLPSKSIELVRDLEYFDGFIQHMNIQVKYVHELQHALRLGRLYELADNFKI